MAVYERNTYSFMLSDTREHSTYSTMKIWYCVMCDLWLWIIIFFIGCTRIVVWLGLVMWSTSERRHEIWICFKERCVGGVGCDVWRSVTYMLCRTTCHGEQIIYVFLLPEFLWGWVHRLCCHMREQNIFSFWHFTVQYFLLMFFLPVQFVFYPVVF